MRLEHDQVWKRADLYLRIVDLDRLRVGYMAMKDLTSGEERYHQVTKKEFCRLLNGAVLVRPAATSPEDS